MPSKREKGGERWEEGDRTAEKKFRKKPKQGDKETIDCVTSGDMGTVSRESCVVCSGDGVLAREREHGRMRETKRNGGERGGEERRGEKRAEDATAHVYVRQQKGINPLLGRRKHKSWRRDSFGGRTANGPGEVAV